MKKPLPVKIVEAIGWTYVALAVLFVAMLAKESADWAGAIMWGVLFPFGPALCMVVALRYGRRDMFMLPHCVILVPPVVYLSAVLFGMVTVGLMTLVSIVLGKTAGNAGLMVLMPLALISFGLWVLFLGPFVLLYLPSSDRWFVEKAAKRASSKKRFPLGTVCGVCVNVAAVVAWPGQLTRLIMPGIELDGGMGVIRFRGDMLSSRMASNRLAHEAGEEWIDPEACTNSIQFVEAIFEKYKDTGNHRFLRHYTNDWCVAVNPPDDAKFPLFFTCNIDPRELLSQAEGDRRLTLTCPKDWGGNCFKLCEKMAMVGYVDGDVKVMRRKNALSKNVFPNGIPKPGPDTYFLTPTGRVDLVARPTL